MSCGDTLITDTMLDESLNCIGTNGVEIGADGITVDLNGFTIAGTVAGNFFGVDNTGGFDDVTIKRGSIVGFEQGIRGEDVAGFTLNNLTFSGQTSSHAIDILDSADVVVKNSSFSLPPWSFGGPEAIRLESVDGFTVKKVDVDGGFIGVNFACGTCDGTEAPSNGVVKNSSFTDNFIGVEIANSTDAEIKENKISGAAFAGIEIDFLVNIGTKISKNEIFDSGGFMDFGFGIIVAFPTSDLEIKKNYVHDNFSDGILLKNVDDSKISKNTVKDNGGDGVSLESGSTGNEIKKNTATGNDDTDMMHDGTSTPNTWTINTCGTSSGADIDCP